MKKSCMPFDFFKRKKKPSLPILTDLDDKPLVEGDKVEALRYNLGKCRLLLEENQYFYESLESGKRVSWVRMIDAITERQKVKKIH